MCWNQTQLLSKQRPWHTVVDNNDISCQIPKSKFEWKKHEIKIKNSDRKLEIQTLQETQPEYFYKKNYSPYWKTMINTIYNNRGKVNVIRAAYEGGHRIERRYQNMNTAFTFGKKITYDDLDDPMLKHKIFNQMA